MDIKALRSKVFVANPESSDAKRQWVHWFKSFTIDSDYFTENFQVKENKTKMRNIYPRFFHLLFWVKIRV